MGQPDSREHFRPEFLKVILKEFRMPRMAYAEKQKRRSRTCRQQRRISPCIQCSRECLPVHPLGREHVCQQSLF